MMSYATTGGSHENAPNIKFSYVRFFLFEAMITLQIRHLQWVDYFNHVHAKLFTTRKPSEYICFEFTMFLLWVNLRYFGAQEELLHVQSVRNMRHENKYELIAIIAILLVTSKHMAWFWLNYAKT